MILGALVDYYEILAKENDKVPVQGYSIAKVSYALNLAEDGTLLSLIPLKQTEKRGKKTIEVPQQLIVPVQAKKSVNIVANFLCGTSSYVLGVDNKGKPERTKKCFEAFKALQHKVLDGVDSVCAKAVLRYLDTWQPDNIQNCSAIKNEIDGLTAGGNIVFNIAGIDFAHKDSKILNAWEKHYASESDSPRMQCLVTGVEAPIARLHPSIKGAGGQPSGVSIVSFNDRAYESYGREKQQGFNAPVSEYAAFAYTTALNHLLADTTYKQAIGDTAVVYWAQSPKKIYMDLFGYSLNPVPANDDDIHVDKATEKLLTDLFGKLAEGKPAADIRGDIDPDTRFFILGLTPNAARLSIRFFIKDSFGSMLENMLKHYDALDIEHAPYDFKYLPLWKLMQETVSPKSKDKAASPLLAGAVLRSIFSGLPYPEALFQSVMRRIRAERDISRGKAAIIKAFLTRNYKERYEEELTVALNEESTNKAYVLGRLFAVLEKTQLDTRSNYKEGKAQPDEKKSINKTVNDSYFASACATPGSVFPILLKLNRHHLSQIKKNNTGLSIKRENLIVKLHDKLKVDDGPYPAHLSLQDQGLFVLGYYHQMKALYTKNTKEGE